MIKTGGKAFIAMIVGFLLGTSMAWTERAMYWIAIIILIWSRI